MQIKETYVQNGCPSRDTASRKIVPPMFSPSEKLWETWILYQE